jgi:hypothetical protein
MRFWPVSLAVLGLIAATAGSAKAQSKVPITSVVRRGGNADWLPANKTGFGTSYTTASNVWFTLQGGRLSEVYYPRIDTPSVRNLDFIVTDGRTFAIRAQDAANSQTRLVNLDYGRSEEQQELGQGGDDPRSLVVGALQLPSLRIRPTRLYSSTSSSPPWTASLTSSTPSTNRS